MNTGFLLLFLSMQLLFSSAYADVMPEENTSSLDESIKNGNEDSNPRLILIDQNNIELSSNDVELSGLNNSQKKNI